MAKKEKEVKERKRSGFRWEAEQMLLKSKNINEALIEKITAKIKKMGGLFPRETCFEVMRKLEIDTTPFKRKRTGTAKVEKKEKVEKKGKKAKEKKTRTPRKRVKKSAHKETVVETDVEEDEEEAILNEFADEEKTNETNGF